MSHITKIGTQITDLQALASACESLGTRLIFGKTEFLNFARRQSPCDHAIVVTDGVNENTYEVGVVSNGDGTYHLEVDNWAGGYGLRDRVGEDASKLIQSYTLEVAAMELEREGFRVIGREVGLNGNMELLVSNE